MEQHHLRRTRTLPTHLREFIVEAASSIQGPCEVSQLAALIRLEHNYSCTSAKAGRPKGLEKHYVKNTAVLPNVQPAVDVGQALLCQQEEPISIHGHSIQSYQEIYHSVAEPMIKTRCGRRRPYTLELGLKIKQRLWEKLSCPSLLETEQPAGRVLITESFSKTSRSLAPQIHVDISEEPLPEEPRRKKARH
ncbi:hypothetical protein QQF64_004629 [Cirrhinus molitorella]|uniref:Uncharacterized protein n=1 Tax=Cirrhinus molitorella TaxID=172907 RepID=A0ABR3MGS1_9TELE